MSLHDASGTPTTCLTCEDVRTTHHYTPKPSVIDHSEEPPLNMEMSLVRLDKVATI